MYKKRQDLLYLDTLIKIENKLKNKTKKLKFIYCYSHTKEVDEIKQDKNIKNKKNPNNDK